MPTKPITARQADKLIQAAQDALVFQVEGSGNFPFDMLRYDLCWPASETASQLLALPATRRVELKGLKVPTARRWASFGWTVV